MNQPLISIIMPAYNASATIKESIDSVLSQSYRHWELIIIDDASTDNTLDVIKNYQKKDKKIKVLKNKNNLKVAKTRNRGLDKAKGQYIAFLDSDDKWTHTKLENQLNFMLKNNIKFSYTNIQILNKKNKELKFEREADYKKLLKGNQISCLTVMLDSSLVNNLRMKDIGHEDYLFWLEILKENNIKAYNVNKTLAYYRDEGDSLSSNKLKAASWQWNIYRNHLKLSLLSSIYNFLFYIINGIKKRI